MSLLVSSTKSKKSFILSFQCVEFKVHGSEFFSHSSLQKSKFPISSANSTSLSFISLAALFVKVTAKILFGLIFMANIRYAILYVRVLVFPDHAPANIRLEVSVCNAAFSCSSFNFVAKYSFIFCI